MILPNWDVFQWVTTALELGAGAGADPRHRAAAAPRSPRSAAALPPLVYLSSGRWMWEQPHEWVPLVILALVPAGRTWGLDKRFVNRGWPF